VNRLQWLNGVAFPRAAQLRQGALLRATSLLAVGDVLAKVLAFGFYVLLAHLVAPGQYGIFRFGLTLGYLGSILAAAFSLTLMHYLASRARADAQPIGAVMTLSLIGSALGLFFALGAAPDGMTVVIGTALMILGLSFSYTYLGINKGAQEFGKAAFYAAVSNIFQLLPVIVSALWFPQLVLAVAMASYGLSYFVTLFLFEWIKPQRLRLALGSGNQKEYGAALRFAAPLILSHGAYQTLFGMDLIWLALFAPDTTVGYYAAAKALATAYAVIPNALYGVLMPKTAEERGNASRHNLKLALLIAVVSNLGLIVLFALTSPLLLNRLFGAGYEQAAPALLVIGIGMLFYALCMVLNAHATGLGTPQVQGMTMLCGLMAAVGVGPFLTMRYGMVGASGSLAFGTLVALSVGVVWSWRQSRQ